MNYSSYSPDGADHHHDPDVAFRADDPSAKRPEIVTLCGSTRFKDAFLSEQARLTLEGVLVISVGLFGHSDHPTLMTVDENGPTPHKVMLDELHKRKIDLCDRVHVINVGGYIGESTRGEIEYAVARGKAVTYLEEPVVTLPAEVLGDIRTVLEYVSQGRSYAARTAYPDASARRALGALASISPPAAGSDERTAQ